MSKSSQVQLKVTLRLMVSQSLSLGVEPHLGLMTRYLLPFDSYGVVYVGRSLFRLCCWPSPAWSFSGPSPLGLVTIFYCLKFEITLFVSSYDSQGHGGGIRPRLHTVLSVAVYSLRAHRTENSASIVEIYLPNHCVATVAALTAANSLLRCLLPSNEQ
jgi:hypothetical protein